MTSHFPTVADDNIQHCSSLDRPPIGVRTRVQTPDGRVQSRLFTTPARLRVPPSPPTNQTLAAGRRAPLSTRYPVHHHTVSGFQYRTQTLPNKQQPPNLMRLYAVKPQVPPLYYCRRTTVVAFPSVIQRCSLPRAIITVPLKIFYSFFSRVFDVELRIRAQKHLLPVYRRSRFITLVFLLRFHQVRKDLQRTRPL